MEPYVKSLYTQQKRLTDGYYTYSQQSLKALKTKWDRLPTRRPKPKNPATSKKKKVHRFVERRVVIRGCIEELRYDGTPLTKLYSSLLAKALIETEPMLKRDFSERLAELGVNVHDVVQS
jgi:hypothetical protein